MDPLRWREAGMRWRPRRPSATRSPPPSSSRMRNWNHRPSPWRRMGPLRTRSSSRPTSELLLLIGSSGTSRDHFWPSYFWRWWSSGAAPPRWFFWTSSECWADIEKVLIKGWSDGASGKKWDFDCKCSSAHQSLDQNGLLNWGSAEEQNTVEKRDCCICSDSVSQHIFTKYASVYPLVFLRYCLMFSRVVHL